MIAGARTMSRSRRRGENVVSAGYVYHGNVADTPLPEVLATILRYSVPGVLEHSTRSRLRKVYFLDGRVIFATSTHRSESLGAYLVERGVIDGETLARVSEEYRRQRKLRLGQVLVANGLLSDGELHDAVRGQVERILWNLFAYREGHVTFRVGLFKDDEEIRIDIPTARVIVSGCRRLPDPRTAASRLGRPDRVLERRTGLARFEELRLESGERALLELVDGRRSVRDLCLEGPYGPRMNVKLLYAFQLLGLVDTARQPRAGGGVAPGRHDPAEPLFVVEDGEGRRLWLGEADDTVAAALPAWRALVATAENLLSIASLGPLWRARAIGGSGGLGHQVLGVDGASVCVYNSAPTNIGRVGLDLATVVGDDYQRSMVAEGIASAGPPCSREKTREGG